MMQDKIKSRPFAAAVLLALCPLTVRAQTAAPLPAAPASASRLVTLRLKFTPGRTFYYSQTTDTDSATSGSPRAGQPGLMGLSGAAMPMKNHLEMLMHQTVRTVRASDGAATAEVGIDSRTSSLNGMALPPPEKLRQMKSYGTLVLLPDGKIVSFTPSAAFGGPVPPELDMSHTSPLGLSGRLPDTPVRVGDTWKSADLKTRMGAQSVLSTLSGLETAGGKTIAVISLTNSGTFDMPGGVGASVPKGMKMSGTFKGTGTLRFDVDAGAMVSQTSRTDTTMAVTLPGGTAPMETQMKAVTTTRPAAPPATP